MTDFEIIDRTIPEVWNGPTTRLLERVMQTFDLFADQAWWKLRDYYVYQMELRSREPAVIFPALARPRDILWLPRTVKAALGQELKETVDFYNEPATVFYRQLVFDRNRSPYLYKKVMTHGLNYALEAFLERNFNQQKAVPFKYPLFHEYFHGTYFLYYTATEDEWSFLFNRFLIVAEGKDSKAMQLKPITDRLQKLKHLTKEKFTEELVRRINQGNLYTQASINALLKFGVVEISNLKTNHIASILIYGAVCNHLDSILEIWIREGIPESGIVLTRKEFLTESTPMLFETVHDLIVQILKADNVLIISKYDDDPYSAPPLTEAKSKEYPRFLKTLATYNSLKRSPLLMFRQRYWEEYWKKVEATKE
jgi:hypothetical protein